MDEAPSPGRLSHIKSYRQELWFNLPARMEFVNITPEVIAALAESGIREGLLNCFTHCETFQDCR